MASLDSYWNTNWEAVPRGGGKYIAITGNTGVGKSTLVAAIADRLKALRYPTIGINERAIHHPLLPLMFRQPSRYAFGVQLNFLLQRHLMLSRWLELGYHVVIERSHLDDRLYMETHLDDGNVSSAEFKAYEVLFNTLSLRLPDPDCLIFLDASPETCIERLTASEQNAERPREFSDEISKEHFVHAWHRKFYQHFANLEAD